VIPHESDCNLQTVGYCTCGAVFREMFEAAIPAMRPPKASAKETDVGYVPDWCEPLDRKR
jgi:hypothetical protein